MVLHHTVIMSFKGHFLYKWPCHEEDNDTYEDIKAQLWVKVAIAVKNKYYTIEEYR